MPFSSLPIPPPFQIFTLPASIHPSKNELTQTYPRLNEGHIKGTLAHSLILAREHGQIWPNVLCSIISISRPFLPIQSWPQFQENGPKETGSRLCSRASSKANAIFVPLFSTIPASLSNALTKTLKTERDLKGTLARSPSLTRESMPICNMFSVPILFPSYRFFLPPPPLKVGQNSKNSVQNGGAGGHFSALGQLSGTHPPPLPFRRSWQSNANAIFVLLFSLFQIFTLSLPFPMNSPRHLKRTLLRAHWLVRPQWPENMAKCSLFSISLIPRPFRPFPFCGRLRRNSTFPNCQFPVFPELPAAGICPQAKTTAKSIKRTGDLSSNSSPPPHNPPIFLAFFLPF